MTRLEENKMIIDTIEESLESEPKGTHEEMITFQLVIISTMLADMSKSLAIIADKAEKGSE